MATDTVSTPYVVSEKQDVTIRAVITRADGIVRDVGIVTANYSNPVKRAYWNLIGLRLANHRIHSANRQAKES